MKRRSPWQSTTAAGISQFLHRRDIHPVAVRSDVKGGRWVIVVNCASMPQAEMAWKALEDGGYTLLEMFASWIIVAEREFQRPGALL